MVLGSSVMRGMSAGSVSLYRGLYRALSTVDYRNVLILPGQGVQTVGMAAGLCSKYTDAKKMFDDASCVVGYDLLKVCSEGPPHELNSTAVAQPAIFVSSAAAMIALREEHPTVYSNITMAMGLSLGECTALYAAGMLSFIDAVQLTHKRGLAMQAASDAYPSGMVSVVGFDAEDVTEACKVASFEASEALHIAVEVAPNNYTVAGGKNACNQFKRVMKKLGARYCKQLPVSGAFHTDYMKSASAYLTDALSTISINQPAFPVISNVSNEIYTVENAKQLLVSQVTSPLKWWSAIDAVIESCNVERIIEIGPGNICSNLVKEVNSDGSYQIKYLSIPFK